MKAIILNKILYIRCINFIVNATTYKILSKFKSLSYYWTICFVSLNLLFKRSQGRVTASLENSLENIKTQFYSFQFFSVDFKKKKKMSLCVFFLERQNHSSQFLVLVVLLKVFLFLTHFSSNTFC